MPSIIHQKSNNFDTFAHGKLLLTGEYAVLDGALALAIPVKFGQSLSVATGANPGILNWVSYHQDGSIWFEAAFALPEFKTLETTDPDIAATLASILTSAQAQNPTFLPPSQGYEVVTKIDFPRHWGLGTSSTLIAAIGQWSKTDPYQILFETMGGSGYDIGCAYAQTAIYYALKDEKPMTKAVSYNPSFRDQLYFVYLGKKQNSREGIAHYQSKVVEDPFFLKKISDLTQRWVHCETRQSLDQVIQDHETLIAEVTKQIRAKTLYFSDFWGEIKSLGAWGGDFVLATSGRDQSETHQYFKEKGFETILSWNQMIEI